MKAAANLVLCLAALSAAQPQLLQMLEEADLFFSTPRGTNEVKGFYELMKNSYGLLESGTRKKRSVQEPTFSIEQGLRVLENRQYLVYINHGSLQDFAAFEANGTTYILSLRKSLSNPSDSLHSLVLSYANDNSGSVIDSVELEASSKLEVYQTSDTVLVLVLRPDRRNAIGGCNVYHVSNKKIRLAQILDIQNSTDLEVASHLGKVYLAVGTTRNIFLYLWQGRYFDMLQEIASGSVNSVSFYDIDNTFFLTAVGGDYLKKSSKTSCVIWEQNMENKHFKCHQYMNAGGAVDVQYFDFAEKDSQRKQHFLAIGFYNAPAIIYKHDGQVFQPFQSIPDHNHHVRWLPYQSGESDFALFLVSDYKTTAFSYDGWRFHELLSDLNHEALGQGCKILRTFYKSNETLLVAVNPSKEVGAILRLSFIDQPSPGLEDTFDWCQTRLDEGDENFKELEERIKSVNAAADDVSFSNQVTFRHLNVRHLNAQSFSSFNAAFVKEINDIGIAVNQLIGGLDDVRTLAELYSNDATIVKGPFVCQELEINCARDSPCLMPNITALFINKQSVSDFISNTVSLKGGVNSTQIMQFEDLRVTDVQAEMINGHHGWALISRENSYSIESLHVRTVVFHGSVFIRGRIQDVLLDREHAIVQDENQTFTDWLVADLSTIKDLSVEGTLNGAKMEDLIDSNPFRDSWEVLNVVNLTVKGDLTGWPVQELMEIGRYEDVIMAENVFVESNIVSEVDLEDLVRVSHGSYNIQSDLTFVESVHVDKLYVTNAINNIPLPALMKLAAATISNDNDSSSAPTSANAIPVTINDVVGEKVIVRQRARFKDIVDSDGNSLTQEVNKKWAGKESEIDDDFNCVDFDDGDHRTFKSNDDNVSVEYHGALSLGVLKASELRISGLINNLNWTELTSDAVFRGEETVITGQKTVDGDIYVHQLSINGFVNGQAVEELVSTLPNRSSVNVDKDLTFTDMLEVQDIFVNGISFFESPNESILINNVVFEAGVKVKTINNIDMEGFVKNAAQISENVELGIVNFVHDVAVENLTSRGYVNGVNFTDTVVISDSLLPQVIDGQWLFRNDVEVDGELVVDGEINGMNLTSLCEMAKTKARVIVAGSVKASVEPKVTKSVNGYPLNDLFDDLWLRSEKTTLKGNVKLSKSEIWGNTRLEGQVNGYNLTRVAKEYLSKTIPRRMKAPLSVANLTVLGRVRAINITGPVNGMKVGEFSANVLQNGVEQHFFERPHFQEIQVETLSGDYTINGFNLAEDVLRHDVEGAIVLGEKKVNAVNVKSLTLPAGVQLQGVNMAQWMSEAVLKDNAVCHGNLSLTTVHVKGSLIAEGKVGPLFLDSRHILTAKGHQKISGQKNLTGPIYMKHLHAGGFVSGVDLRKLIKSSLYTDQDVSIASSLEIDNIKGDSLYVAGNLAGRNVTHFCELAGNITQLNDFDDNYSQLLLASQKISHNLENGAYFLDHYRMVQKFHGNVTGVVEVPGRQEPMIAVFRDNDNQKNVTHMVWDSRDKVFKQKEETDVRGLSGNVTLVATGPSVLFTEVWNEGGVLFYKNRTFFVNALHATCAVPFTRSISEICFFMGQANQSDVVMCEDSTVHDLHPVQLFKTTGCIQAVAVKAGNKTWLAVVGRKMYRPPLEIYVTVYSMADGMELFHPRQDLAVIHPVSVAAIAFRRYSFLVVASQHQPESVRSSLLSIFRYTRQGDKWTRFQEIAVEAPVDATFEELPTGQLVLYVLTANPAKPFLVFLYRGVEGFVEETSGLATHRGKILSIFNVENHHFVAIAGYGTGQLLQAEMYGRKRI